MGSLSQCLAFCPARPRSATAPIFLMTDPPRFTDRSQYLPTRRSVLRVTGAIGGTALAGCLNAPSSGGPPYTAHEIDDGPVFGPGLRDENEREYYAALVTNESGVGAFEERRMDDDSTTFLEETDFSQEYLGVVQVSKLNSSMRFDVLEIQESDVNLTVVVAVRDEPPYSDDRVITTLLVRVTSQHRTAPDRIGVELDIGDHHETFSGG